MQKTSSPPDWSSPNALQPGGKDALTDFTPSVVGHGGLLYCVWLEDDKKPSQKKLCLSTLEGDKWKAASYVGLADKQPETACNSPSMATLNGVIHMVFPDVDHNLVHLQLDPTQNVWGKRCGLLASSASAPCLAAYRDQLFCVYRNDGAGKKDSAGTLHLAVWSEPLGWQKSSKIDISDATGQVAIFELMARLQLLSVDKKDGFKRYAYSDTNASWQPLEGLGKALKPESGVTVQCVNDFGFIGCTKDGGASVSQLDQENWMKHQKIPSSTTCITPAVAVVDNAVICIWIDKAKKSLQWSKRKAVEIPQLDRWMSGIADKTLISALTIPGTHDAAAISNAPFVGCHTMSIESQLNMGIRYFDIRAGMSKRKDDEGLVALHAGYTISGPKGFRSELDIISIFKVFSDFVGRTKEGLIVQIKQDREENDDARARQFSTAIHKLCKDFKWLLGNKIPTIEELRGRVQLVRRFRLPPKMGIDALGIDPMGTDPLGIDVFQNWDANKNNILGFKTSGPDYYIHIQDHYHIDWFGSPDTKFELVEQYLGKAKNDREVKNLYINFASAVQNIPLDMYPARNMACGYSFVLAEPTVGVNTQLSHFFNKAAAGRYGIILMDYPEEPEELLLAMIKTNFPGA